MKIYLLCAMFLGFSGCAGFRVSRNYDENMAKQKSCISNERCNFAKICSGRFSFSYPNISGQHSRINGFFSLSSSDNVMRWELKSLIGHSLAFVRFEENGLTVEKISKFLENKIHLKQLQSASLKYLPPVRSLDAWIDGIPSSFSTFEGVKYDLRGRVIYFEQNGWNVSYVYDSSIVKYPMYRRITLIKRQPLQQDCITIVLVF